MKFHIVITDNETGEVLKDSNAVAILASVQEDDGTSQLTLTKCDGRNFMAAICGLLGVHEKIKKENPKELEFAQKIFKKHKKEIEKK